MNTFAPKFAFKAIVESRSNIKKEMSFYKYILDCVTWNGHNFQGLIYVPHSLMSCFLIYA